MNLALYIKVQLCYIVIARQHNIFQQSRHSMSVRSILKLIVIAFKRRLTINVELEECTHTKEELADFLTKLVTKRQLSCIVQTRHSRYLCDNLTESVKKQS